MVLDHVGQRHHARPGVLRKEGGDPVAASAAADQAHFDVGIGLIPECRGRLQDEDAGGGGLQETAATAFILCHEHLLLSEMVAARTGQSTPPRRTPPASPRPILHRQSGTSLGRTLTGRSTLRTPGSRRTPAPCRRSPARIRGAPRRRGRPFAPAGFRNPRTHRTTTRSPIARRIVAGQESAIARPIVPGALDSAIAPEPNHARPANPRLSVDTFTFSPSLIKRGTRISRPVSSVAGLVTLPLDESPRTPGSVEATSSATNIGNSKPMGLPLYLSNSTRVPPIRKSNAFPITSSARVRVS